MRVLPMLWDIILFFNIVFNSLLLFSIFKSQSIIYILLAKTFKLGS